MSKLLFVVHRAYPFPGGSEYYVQDMAEECKRRGHDVTILAHEHQGNSIRVTSDYNILIRERFDLIIVHGGDVISQNIVHINAFQIKSPIAYMIIKPSDSPQCVHGMKYADILAYSTDHDLDHIAKYGHLQKARRIRHGIVPDKTIASRDVFRKRYKLEDKKLIVSAGGFSPHKGMSELAEIVNGMENPNIHLCLFGYIGGEEIAETSKVSVFQDFGKWTVMEAIADADLYVMNSYEEGFGLVLLEAMMNRTPWAARAGVGAVNDMEKYGCIYADGVMDLQDWIGTADKSDMQNLVETNYNYVMSNHTIVQTVNDIEDIIMELS